MKILLYIGILGLLFLVPTERLEVAKLQPVQTVAVSTEEETIVLETDTKNKGQGKTVQMAVQDLEENTPGVIYLDTAQYLLITEAATEYADDIAGYLHSRVRVSVWDGKGSVEQAAKFLSVRRDLPSIKRWLQRENKK